MQFDTEKQVLTLEDGEPEVIQRPGEEVRTVWPAGEALGLALEIAEAKNRISGMDISSAPVGSARAELLARQQRLLQTARNMGRFIEPHLPTVDEEGAQSLF